MKKRIYKQGQKMFCPHCHHEVKMPFEMKKGMSFGSINLTCGSCRQGVCVMEGNKKKLTKKQLAAEAKKPIPSPYVPARKVTINDIQHTRTMMLPKKKAEKKLGENTIKAKLMVRTKKGVIDITEVKVGDFLLGANNKFNKVIEVDPGRNEGDFYNINGDITLFSEQSIMANGNVTHVRLLKKGDTIYSFNEKEILVKSIKKVKGIFYFHKLTLKSDHTYFMNGILMHNASRFCVTGGGSVSWTSINTAIWSASSGGGTGASVPGSADAVVLDGSSGGGTVTPNYDMTVVSIVMSNFNGTLDFSANNNSPTMGVFTNSSSVVRTFNMGNGTWTITGNNTTVWSQSVITNLTFNSNGSTLQFTYSGSVGTRTIATGASTVSYNNISVTAGSDTISQSGVWTMAGSFSTVGFTGTYSKTTSGLNVTGSFTLGTGSTWTSTGGTISLISLSGSVSINTNGVNVNQGFVIGTTGSTGTFSLSGAFDMSGSVAATLNWNSGIFTTNNFNITTPMFVTSNTNTRTWNAGTTTMTITGNNATVFNIATITNATINASGLNIVFSYSGSVGTRVLGLNSSVPVGNVTVNPATDILQFSLNTNFTGTFTCSQPFASNSAGAVRTITAKSFVLSGVTSISDMSLAMSNNGGTFSMSEDLNFTGTVAGALTLSGGTFTTNNFNINAKTFSSPSGTRNISLGSSIMTLSGTGTVFSIASVSGLTWNAGTSTIKITDTSVSSKTVSELGVILYNLWFTGGSGTLIIGTTTTASTYNNLRIDPAATVQVFAGKTITLTGTTPLTIAGTAGNINTISSTVAASPWFLNINHQIVSLDYMSFQDTQVTGDSHVFAGTHSTNVSGNQNIVFTDPTQFTGPFPTFFQT